MAATQPGMHRIGFLLKISDDPVLQQEYKQFHAAVWPEMQDALKRTGWHNYSLFLKKDGTLFGVFESDKTLQECIQGMEKEEINAKWQAAMQKFFPAADKLRPDETIVELEEVMHINY